MTIHAVLVFNNQGKPRLTRFYTQLPIQRQQALLRIIFRLVSRRTAVKPVNGRSEALCNFLEAPELRTHLHLASAADGGRFNMRGARRGGPTSDGKERPDSLTPGLEQQLRVIYRHYATLYFIFVVDGSESELGILDLIQVFVESLDRLFSNVCELDLIFHFDQVHAVLSEMIQGGVVLETSAQEIVACARESQNARKASSAGTGTSGALPGAVGRSPGNVMEQFASAGLTGLQSSAWGLVSQVGNASLGALRGASGGYAGDRRRTGW